jgi:hypothetical protein
VHSQSPTRNLSLSSVKVRGLRARALINSVSTSGRLANCTTGHSTNPHTPRGRWTVRNSCVCTHKQNTTHTNGGKARAHHIRFPTPSPPRRVRAPCIDLPLRGGSSSTTTAPLHSPPPTARTLPQRAHQQTGRGSNLAQPPGRQGGLDRTQHRATAVPRGNVRQRGHVKVVPHACIHRGQLGGGGAGSRGGGGADSREGAK